MGALSSLATVGLNAALARQAARRQSRAIEAERDREIEAIRQREAEERREQRDLLRRRLAAQRARAAAAGVGGRGGSADAVLRGLVEEAEAEARARQTELGRDIRDLRRSARERRRRNLLDLVGDTSRSSLRLLSSGSRRERSLLDL